MIYENDRKNVQYPIKATIMHGNLPFMNHCHQDIEIILIQEGSLTVTYEAEEYQLKKGSIWIVPPFGSHSIGIGSSDCKRLVILLDIQIAGSWEKEYKDWIGIQNRLEELELCSNSWQTATADYVAGLVESIYQEYVDKAYAWELAEKTLVNQLLLTAVREFPQRKDAPERKQYSKIKNILEYIALHYCERITLQACADYVGFNATYLSRYFSKHMGMTFQEYVKKLRIDKAKWLLMTESLPITEVCYRSGFGDVKTFNKLFRKECGKSPTEFKKEL